ncbi:MAG: aminotransferase, partial [Armatimonadota bacterium]
KDTFGYQRHDSAERGEGGDAWLESTPPVLVPFQATPGLEFTLTIGVERIRDYMNSVLADLRETFLLADLPVFVPLDAENWGGFALIPHAKATELSQRLKTHKVVTDARRDYVRFGPDLLTTHEEIEQAALALRGLL